MRTFDANTLAAVKLLGIYTAGSFRFSALYGRQKASVRAHIMSALAGKNVPQRASGINELYRAIVAALDISGNCDAERNQNIVIRCRGIVNMPQIPAELIGA